MRLSEASDNRIVQNHEAFAFIDQLLGSSINFETAGSLHGGRRVWVLATLPEHVEVGGDSVRPYVLLMNSHDGWTAVIAATTPIRVVTGEMQISVWLEFAWAPTGWGVVVARRSPEGCLPSGRTARTMACSSIMPCCLVARACTRRRR